MITHETLPSRMIAGTAPPAIGSLGENGGFLLDTDPGQAVVLPAESPILNSIGKSFSVDDFSEARTPVSLGTFDLGSFRTEISVSDMAIKMPGMGYRVPVELFALRAVLNTCAGVEQRINPEVDDYYAYLTVQHSTVTKGFAKRGLGAHSDSIQGPRIQPKQPIEHGYVIADRDPTRFFTHSFDLSGLDPDLDWLGSEIKEQADVHRSLRLGLGELALFDAYTIHAGVPSETDGRRTFVRLLYSVRQFDRLGNTVNRLFDYSGWDFKPRPIPSGLHGMPVEISPQKEA